MQPSHRSQASVEMLRASSPPQPLFHPQINWKAEQMCYYNRLMYPDCDLRDYSISSGDLDRRFKAGY
jgi:hypothetical protein